MASSWRKKGEGKGDPWSMEVPASKKRKVEKQPQERKKLEESKDEWNDSDDFTQAELETLDVMASQAINQDPNPTEMIELQSETSFVVPTHAAPSGANRSASSSDSSLHPPSLSSRSSSDTSGSLSSHSSTNGKVGSSRDLAQILQAKLDQETKSAQEEKYRLTGEVKYLRESVHKQEEELEKLRAMRDERFDEQKRINAEKMQKLQAQLDSLISEAQFKEREHQTLREQNLLLQQKVKKLEQPQQQSSRKATAQLSPSPKQSSPRKVPVKPSPPSKQQQQLQKQMETAPASQRIKFPTELLFMERVTAPPPPSATSTKSDHPSVSCQTTGVVNAEKPPQRRRIQLNIGSSKVSKPVSGPKIVSHLLRSSITPVCTRNGGSLKLQWDPGLASLLHAVSSSAKIAGLNRRNDSSGLSPFRPKRNRQGMRPPGTESGDPARQVVNRENYQLAVEGLTRLLNEPDQMTDTENLSLEHLDGESVGTIGQVVLRAQNVSRTSEPSLDAHDPKKKRLTNLGCVPDKGLNSGAVMLLPLLTDYVQCYVDMLQSSVMHGSSTFIAPHMSFPSPSSMSSSHSFMATGSCDSSVDSLSSHMAQLLQDGKIYAYNVEGYALSALRCLARLIHLCPAVGQAIVSAYKSTTVSGTTLTNVTTTSSSSTTETDAEPSSKKATSGGEADDERSTSSSEIRIITGTDDQSLSSFTGQDIHHRVSPTLLHLILRLAEQDLQDNQLSSEIVQAALSVLTYLCQSCTQEQKLKLEIITVRGTLSSCFKQTQHPSVLLWAQRLLVALSKSDNLLMKLCSRSDNCPWYLMHCVCSARSREMSDFYKEYIISLSSIITEHRTGLYSLLSNACRCTEELVAAVIMALYKLFDEYKKMKALNERKQSLLNILAQGVILIYTLAQGDAQFAQHQAVVQLQYVHLLSGLATIMRSQHHKWEHHLSALEELCDFEPDMSDLSQESESEDKIDQS